MGGSESKCCCPAEREPKEMVVGSEHATAYGQALDDQMNQVPPRILGRNELEITPPTQAREITPEIMEPTPGRGDVMYQFPLCGGFGDRMDENEMLAKAWWCLFCCCAGAGCSGKPRPFSIKSLCLVCDQRCETVDMFEPAACTCIQTVCCCSAISQLPFRDGHPRCVLCGNDFCGVVGGVFNTAGRGASLEEAGLIEYDTILFDNFVPCYCTCAGVAIHTSNCTLLRTIAKCLCCGYWFNTSLPNINEGLCKVICNCWWLLGECRCPPWMPPRATPVCAVCNCRLRSSSGLQ